MRDHAKYQAKARTKIRGFLPHGAQGKHSFQMCSDTSYAATFASFHSSTLISEPCHSRVMAPSYIEQPLSSIGSKTSRS